MKNLFKINRALVAKKKIFTLAAAVLCSIGLWAAVVPSAVWTVGDITTLSTNGWADKGQTNSVYQNGDTVAINAYLAYQSVSKQEWIGYNAKGGSSSTETAWDKIKGFGGAAYYNVVDKDSKHLFATTNSKDPRDYQFHVTNCIEVYVYGNAQSSDRNIDLKAYEIDAEGSVSSTAAKSAQYSATTNGSFGITGLDASKKYRISVKGDNKSNCSFFEIAFVSPAKAPTLAAITIAGVEATIDESAATITAELPYGTVINDAIDTATITLGGSAKSYEIGDDYTTLTVYNEDESASKVYTFDLTVAASASTDATLKALAVNDVEITLEEDVFEYTVELPYSATVVAVCEVNYPTAEAAEPDYSTEGKVIIVVTAQAGNTETYTVNYTILPAPKSLSRVLFSNGFDAFINNTNHTVKAYYLADTDAPTATTITAGDGTASEIVDGKITVTGEDAETVDYTVTLEAVTPYTTVSATAGTFAGDEAWVKNGLLIDGVSAGWVAGGKYYVLRRQLKNGDAADDQRVIAGWVRSYFFVGHTKASILELTVANNNNIKYAVDGGSYTESSANTLSISLTAGNHMVEIVTNQSSGDCRLSAPKLSEDSASALDNTADENKAVKRLENGMLVIEKDGKLFNILGGRIR